MFKQTKSFGKFVKQITRTLVKGSPITKLLITTTPSEKKGVKRTKDNKQMLQQRVIALLELLESNPSGKIPIRKWS